MGSKSSDILYTGFASYSLLNPLPGVAFPRHPVKAILHLRRAAAPRNPVMQHA